MREGLIVIAVLGIMIGSCQKTPPSDILPPPTNSGEHTLGFFVNGKAWIPYDRGSHEAHELPIPTLTDEGGLKISATRIDDEQSCRHWFCIEIENGCNGTGKYQLSNVECTSPYQTFYYGSNGDKTAAYYEIDSLQPHYIDINFMDKRKKIICGEFEFDAFSNNGDTIKVRSGRFDLNYK